jgi:starch phosphorylase
LYSVLENEVVPLFYSRDNQGIPREWVQHMRASMAQLGPQFSSNRMLHDYLEQYYQPAIQAFRRRGKDQAALAHTPCLAQGAGDRMGLDPFRSGGIAA